MQQLLNLKLADILPNPHRDLAFNPYNEEKIAALMASIEETGFWSNVIVRPSPDGKGYEQSYGHHSIEAARRSGITEAEFVVQDLDDSKMLKMMEKENQEDYRYCPLSLLESVKAVVKALAEGKIASKISNQVNRTTPLYTYRYAPHYHEEGFGVNKEGVPYTTTDVARSLGYKDRSNHDHIKTALNALYLLEVGTITTSTIKSMNWAQLGNHVTRMKIERKRTILLRTKTREEIENINAEALRVQAEQNERERKAEEERQVLVKKLAEMKRDEDVRRAKEIRDRIDAKDEAERIAQENRKKKLPSLEDAVEQRKQNEVRRADKYAPIKGEVKCLLLYMDAEEYLRDFYERAKALARKQLTVGDRELLRQSALKLGTWYSEDIATLFVPPLTSRKNVLKIPTHGPRRVPRKIKS